MNVLDTFSTNFVVGNLQLSVGKLQLPAPQLFQPTIEAAAQKHPLTSSTTPFKYFLCHSPIRYPENVLATQLVLMCAVKLDNTEECVLCSLNMFACHRMCRTPFVA